MGILFLSFFSFLTSLYFSFYENFFTYFFFLLVFLLKGFDSYEMIFSFQMYSWSLIVLSFFICSLMLVANMNFSFFLSSFNFLFYVFLMAFSLMVVFQCSSLFFFYVFFEFSVIPIFFIICSLGFSFERLESAFYMFFYTLSFALPFFIHMLKIDVGIKSLSFFLFDFFYEISLDWFFVSLSIFMFFVSIPSFFLHLWLPKAHVEAPVSGSMILAGLLLKLGTYGLYVYMSVVFFYVLFLSDFYFLWGVWGAFLASFCCFFQVDMKKMIAYMSVMHMGMVISGIFSFLYYLKVAIFFMMCSHGLTSSLMFFSLNCFYERLHSRSIIILKGGFMSFPFLYLLASMAVASNMGIPPSLSFFSELFLIFCMMEYVFGIWFFLFTLVFMSSLVTIYYLVSLFHGFHLGQVTIFPLKLKEILIHIAHLIPIYMIFLFF